MIRPTSHTDAVIQQLPQPAVQRTAKPSPYWAVPIKIIQNFKWTHINEHLRGLDCTGGINKSDHNIYNAQNCDLLLSLLLLCEPLTNQGQLQFTWPQLFKRWIALSTR